MRGLVTDEEGEFFGIDIKGVGGAVHKLFLEEEGAFFEPVMLDHGIGKALFGVGFRLVFVVDAGS